MTINEIVQDIHGLDAELRELEQRYGLLSPDFYHLYRAGEVEQSRDFIEWVGYYEAKLDRERQYRDMMYGRLRGLRQSSGIKALELKPEPVLAGALVLDVWELVDFEKGRIRNYSYEVYRRGEKVRWYEPFAHPDHPELASSFPHHKHVPPDIKRNRVPAPEISFTEPNVPRLVEALVRERG